MQDRVTIEIPPGYHRELKIEAAKRGIHLRVLIAEIVGDWLQKQAEEISMAHERR